MPRNPKRKQVNELDDLFASVEADPLDVEGLSNFGAKLQSKDKGAQQVRVLNDICDFYRSHMFDSDTVVRVSVFDEGRDYALVKFTTENFPREVVRMLAEPEVPRWTKTLGAPVRDWDDEYSSGDDPFVVVVHVGLNLGRSLRQSMRSSGGALPVDRVRDFRFRGVDQAGRPRAIVRIIPRPLGEIR